MTRNQSSNFHGVKTCRIYHVMCITVNMHKSLNVNLKHIQYYNVPKKNLIKLNVGIVKN